MIDLNRLIEQANELAPLPTSTVRLFKLLEDPMSNVADVAEIVAYDQALTLKLLRAANSVTGASATPVTSVAEAVLRLGAASLVTLAVASGVRPALRVAVPAYGLDEGALWRHSVAAAVAAEVLPRFCSEPAPPETFTAALLHDVGKLVMGRFLSPEILDFIQRAQRVEHLGQLEAESLILSVHHAELGGLIAQHWKLPARVVCGISHHHQPTSGADIVCDYVYVANFLAKHIEAGLDGKPFQADLDDEVLVRLGLPRSQLDGLIPAAAERYTAVSGRYHAA